MDLSILQRILSEDEHEHEGEHDEEAEKQLIARIVMIIFILFAGAFVFLPYSKYVKNKEDEN